MIRSEEDNQIEECGEIAYLRSENEKLAVDSVALNEVISVVRNWNRELRSNTLVRMKQIVDIVEERDD